MPIVLLWWTLVDPLTFGPPFCSPALQLGELNPFAHFGGVTSLVDDPDATDSTVRHKGPPDRKMHRYCY